MKNKNLVREVDNLQYKIGSVIDNLVSEIEELEDRVDTLEEENEGLSKNVEQLESENEFLQSQIDDLHMKIQNLTLNN